jgi:TP901 family phage tail tape measure protein
MLPAAVLSILVRTDGAAAAVARLRVLDTAAKTTSGSMTGLAGATNAASASQSRLGAAAAKGRAGLAAASRGAGLVALGVGAIGAASVKAAADYEQSMNTLKAVSGATGSEMARLSKLAKQLGADVRLPGTSAQDAAEAMTEMIKAGVSMKDTMAGVRSTLVLSAAAQISNADAAEIASNALNTFKLRGRDVAMVSDQLANTANASSVEIRDVADAMKMAGAVFSGFQGPVLGAKGALTELNVAVGLLGNAGIKGSDAGTSLKQALLQLTGPSEKSKTAMQALYGAAQRAAGAQDALNKVQSGSAKERNAAIQQMKALNPELKKGGDIAYDAAGRMRSLKDIIRLVTLGTKGMTQEQKNWYLTQIFGADATRSIIALMQAGPQAWDKMTASVTKQGAAQALADAKMKGLKGSFDALKSTLQTLAITFGTVLLPALTAALRGFTNLLSGMDPKVLGIAIVAIGGVAAAVWILNAAMAANPVGLVVVGLILLGAALVTAYQKIEGFRNVVDAAFAVMKTVAGFVAQQAVAAFNALKVAAQITVAALVTAFNAVQGPASAVGAVVGGALVTAFNAVRGAVQTAAGAVTTAFNAAVGAVRTAVNATVAEVAKWKVAFAVIGVIVDVVRAAFAPLAAIVRAAVSVIPVIVRTAFNVLPDIVRTVFPVILAIWQTQFGIILGVTKAIAAQVINVFRTMWNVAKAIFSGAFTAIKGLVLGFGQILHGVIQIIGGILKGDFGQIWEGVKNIFKGAGTALTGIVKGFATGIVGAIAAIGDGIWNAFKSAFQSAKSLVVSFVTDVVNVINKLPFIPDIKLNLGGGGGGGAHNVDLSESTGRLARGGAFAKTGGRGVVNRPIVLMGEEAPTHPEFVIPTNPAYRGRAQGLLAAAGSAIGMARGGVLSGLTSALGGIAGRLLDKGPGELLKQLPSNPLKAPLTPMGTHVLSEAAGYIKKKVGDIIGDIIGFALPEGFTGGRRVAKMIAEANRISSLNSPYIYGGFSDAGYDCSGLVSAILNAGGFNIGRQTTDGLKVFGESGDGQVVTIGVRGSTGRSAHTMLKIGNRFVESGSGHGAKWVSGWSGNFPIHRHPEGFAKGGVFGATPFDPQVDPSKLAKVDPFDPKVVGWGLRKGGVFGRMTRRMAAGGVTGNVKAVAAFLRGKGFTPAQIAGIIGVMQGESGPGLSTTATNPSSGAYGIAQWLGGRKTALMARRNPSSLQTQLAHLWSELQGPESAAYTRIKGAHTIPEAVVAWMDGFERGSPAERTIGARTANARAVFTGLADSGGPTTSRAAAGGGGGGGSSARKKLEDLIAKNQTRIDALRRQARHLPGGSRGASQRATIQDKIADLLAKNRGIRRQIKDLPKAGETPVTAYQVARGRADLQLAKAQTTSGARDDINAYLKQLVAVNARIKRVSGLLKKPGGSKATRLGRQQELAGLLNERTSIQSSLKEARTSLLPPQVDTGAGGDGGDPNQALIDALAATAEQQRKTEEAVRAQTEAIAASAAELKRQTDFGQSVVATENFVLKKSVAELVGSGLGASLVQRGFMPGYGQVGSY